MTTPATTTSPGTATSPTGVSATSPAAAAAATTGGPPSSRGGGPAEPGHKARGRAVRDQVARLVMWGAFLLALVPLVWILWTVGSKGYHLLLDAQWWTNSQRGITSRREGGGAVHAIQGTIIQGLATAAISVPIGILTAIYLVEYGRGKLARGITFLVDVMTGIPSIVAGLFAFALFALFAGPGIRMGFMGSVALSVLMIPVVVRSTEEMLKIVPNELREASYALGVPKWRTITKVVIPTAIGGIASGSPWRLRG
jgi:phosphate transport system permease protein